MTPRQNFTQERTLDKICILNLCNNINKEKSLSYSCPINIIYEFIQIILNKLINSDQV